MPGSGEQQAVDHPHAPLVAVEHRGQPSAQPAAVELHVRLGAEGVEHLLALVVRQLVEGELVVVAHELGPLARRSSVRSLRRALAIGPRRRARARGTWPACR